MAINPDAVGLEGEPSRRSWASKDALLYALGVGVGAGVDELQFTTENTKNTPQRVLPTMAAFMRGEGGFGGERGPSPSFELPNRKADREVRYETRIDQPRHVGRASRGRWRAESSMLAETGSSTLGRGRPGVGAAR